MAERPTPERIDTDYLRRMVACSPFADSKCGVPEMTRGLTDAAAEIDALRSQVATLTAERTERDAEILRLRTACNTGAHAIDRLRQELTDLPVGSHPSEVATMIEGDFAQDTERLKIANATIGYMAEERDRLTSERDTALADAGTLATECTKHRAAMDSICTCEYLNFEEQPCRGCKDNIVVREAMKSTDTTAALSRHGGGA